ncbi:tyrosine-type recombinase/integrase [Pseudomonas syringae]|uniref:Tyrosine-type recombinase/integrase n=1 Tax=Pseudomonas syringae CC1417 TaxID=1357272 RepID=A0AAU8LE36_PSESX
MGTITPRRRKENSVSYTAQIRINRDGRTVYQESQTFNRKQLAKAGIKRREAEPDRFDAIDRANYKSVTLTQMIDRYLIEYGAVRPPGKNKRVTLTAIGKTWLGSIPDVKLTSQNLVEYAQWRLGKEGGSVQAQTVDDDLAHLGALLAVARPAWGYIIDPMAMADVRKVLRKMGAVTRSVERERGPTLDELDRILHYFEEMRERRKQEIDMVRIVLFAMFSIRRQEEITRIKWSLMDEDRQSVLITDMKNPGQKYGNDVWCHVPDEAWRIMNSMPQGPEGPFPYNAKSVSASFTRACNFLEIDDLHFHDLRHDGVSRLFEIGWNIPKAAFVSGHRDWNSMRRYTHLRGDGDRYQGWEWIKRAINGPTIAPGNRLNARNRNNAL